MWNTLDSEAQCLSQTLVSSLLSYFKRDPLSHLLSQETSNPAAAHSSTPRSSRILTHSSSTLHFYRGPGCRLSLQGIYPRGQRMNAKYGTTYGQNCNRHCVWSQPPKSAFFFLKNLVRSWEILGHFCLKIQFSVFQINSKHLINHNYSLPDSFLFLNIFPQCYKNDCHIHI